eukprot:m.411935 g.411935  ORF g.411935 m.411935 type:complete len:95 (-) comp28759_c0_seq1:109-393(-)
MSQMAGGYGAASSPDSNAKVVGMLKNLHGDIVNTLKADPNAEHTIVSVSTQVVAGTNYKVVFTVGGRQASCTVFEPLPHTHQPPRLTAVQWSDQ